MDDELPILIYIVLHTNTINLIAELELIYDFIKLYVSLYYKN